MLEVELAILDVRLVGNRESFVRGPASRTVRPVAFGVGRRREQRASVVAAHTERAVIVGSLDVLNARIERVRVLIRLAERLRGDRRADPEWLRDAGNRNVGSVAIRAKTLRETIGMVSS